MNGCAVPVVIRPAEVAWTNAAIQVMTRVRTELCAVRSLFLQAQVLAFLEVMLQVVPESRAYPRDL